MNRRCCEEHDYSGGINADNIQRELNYFVEHGKLPSTSTNNN